MVEEAELEMLAKKQFWGVEIEELAAAARSVGLEAEIATLDLNACRQLISVGVYPISQPGAPGEAFPLGRRRALANFIPHAVVPVRITDAFVTYNDPLSGRRRRCSCRKFEAAQADLAKWCLVCRPSDLD